MRLRKPVVGDLQHHCPQEFARLDATPQRALPDDGNVVTQCTDLCKLPVRYEKLERSVLALSHLAAAIIAFSKVLLNTNRIYG